MDTDLIILIKYSIHIKYLIWNIDFIYTFSKFSKKTNMTKNRY